MSKGDLIISKPNKRTPEQLSRLQNIPMVQKTNLSMRRIKQFYGSKKGNVSVSFSGGKDSTVLLHLVRSMYPNVPAVFFDTGLEFPEIREFVKTIDNVIWLKPDMSFKKVIEKWGYPVPGKKHAENIYRYRTTKSKRIKEEIKNSSGVYRKMPQKWKFLLDAPFQCSHKCCDELKKKPAKKYEKESGTSPFVGTMAYESRQRSVSWINHGCNIYDGARPRSTPLSFWVESDIWEYIKKHNIQYSKIYDMGYERTGCMFCMFGHYQSIESGGVDRFDMMKRTHPKQYKYCMEKLGIKEVLRYIDEKLGRDQLELFEKEL